MTAELARKLMKVEGRVQGVGFRPFVYNLACEYRLKGWVNNTSQGVKIDIEGREEEINKFITRFEMDIPPLAEVENITIEDRALKGYEVFEIRGSEKSTETLTLVSPDAAICSQCKEELQTPQDRRYRYPFINCTNCGPRFSIIKELPYDRAATTMNSFTMCKQCRKEYKNPNNRRFHAQPNACPDCGPTVKLTDNQGEKLTSEEPIKRAVSLLAVGKILAVKGLGGFHLICDAGQEEAVKRLRLKKRRPDKPLAVMMKDIKTVEKYCEVSDQEVKILQGIRKPIVLVPGRNKLSLETAPDTDQLGVMLPYTPLHYLLFAGDLEVLIATSGNKSGLSIEYKNQLAEKRLAELVDYFLIHDRKIQVPVDDSVVQVLLGKERVIRRSRGYVPEPIKIKGLRETLACGADFKNTFCLTKGQFAFLSQHNGDLDNLETYQRFKQNIKHLEQLYDIKPKIIAHDLHPDYYTTQFAQSREGMKVGVQHHHAHIVSCMVEQNLKPPVIGLAFDGTGFGADGNIWGGEFLICNYRSFRRSGHLNYVKMPGGNRAVTEPWRMAVSYLYEWTGEKFPYSKFFNLSKEDIEVVVKMLKKNLNFPKTSSLGRLFAGVSALLGLCEKRSYQPQAAVKLERTALQVETREKYTYQINKQAGKYIVNTDYIIKGIVKDIEGNIAKEIIARKFHNTVVNFAVKLCKITRSSCGLNKVVLSGGVFQNKIVSQGIYNSLQEADFKVYLPEEVPCNDGGLALGQSVIANQRESRLTVT